MENFKKRWKEHTTKSKVEKKGIFIIEVEDEEYFANMEAAKACPVKIIKVEKTK